jgi:hypothetical protein
VSCSVIASTAWQSPAHASNDSSFCQTASPAARQLLIDLPGESSSAEHNCRCTRHESPAVAACSDSTPHPQAVRHPKILHVGSCVQKHIRYNHTDKVPGSAVPCCAAPGGWSTSRTTSAGRMLKQRRAQARPLCHPTPTMRGGQSSSCALGEQQEPVGLCGVLACWRYCCGVSSSDGWIVGHSTSDG